MNRTIRAVAIRALWILLLAQLPMAGSEPSPAARNLNPAVNQWTWVGGADRVADWEMYGVYGTKGAGAPQNYPGVRSGSVRWTDASGNVWIFGGDGYGATASGFWLNDFWKWDGATWTWVGGSNGLFERGIYGTKGVPDPLNAPGARRSALSFTDAGGNLWLFGGEGNAANSSGFLNDLWKWNGTSWTWVKGSNESDQNGSYGTRGVPATGNTPGARRAAVSWTDATGNFWLFGGDGADYSIGGDRNDLWRWDGTNWTWMSGSNTPDEAGTYGSMGVPAPGNMPGARSGSVSWTDASGNLWLLGGTHETASGLEMRNDLWKWDGTNWTWLGGSNEPNQLGIYGTKGVAAPANRPGARHSAGSWTDASGNFWLFGGYGQAESLTGGLNDLWKWDGTNWTWKSGERWPSSVGYAGTKGEAAPGNTPGARSEAVSWTDAGGNLWLSGGLDHRALGGLRYLNDTWRWDGTNWTWMSGTDGSSLFGTYGPPGVPLPGNLPGARMGALAWTTADGSFSVFGGGGFARSSSGALNDLWRWDGTSWTWASGSDWPDVSGTHGTKGVPAPENVPGSRGGAVSWTDSDGHFWLMGGGGPGIGGWGDRNDLWTWDGVSWTWVSGSEEANQAGIYGTNGVPAPENVPGGRSGATSWTDGSGSFWLYGGYGQAESSEGYLNDLWKWNGTAWTWRNGSREPNRTAVYGTKGIPAPENTPGGRLGSISWRDANGDFWLFGGSGAAAPDGGLRNDLWKWDGTSWTWVSGSNLVHQDGVYGSKGVGAPASVPGARTEAVSWTDANGYLWLFGGVGYASGEVRELNDLWKWDGVNWTWVGGSDRTGQSGTYGTKGVPAEGNGPGARSRVASWKDSSGSFWLLGGDGRDALGRLGYLNDIWSFSPPSCTSPVAAISSPAAICARDGALPASTLDAGAGVTYAWSATGGTIVSGSGSREITFSPTAGSASVVLTVTVAHAGGCATAASATVVNLIPADPAPTNDGPACEGGTLNLTTQSVVGATYAWVGPGGFTSGERLPVLSNVTTAMAGDYDVTVSVASCVSATGRTTAVVHAPPARPEITVPATIGPGQSFKASVPDVAGMTWAWTVTNGTVMGGAGTREITVTAGEMGPVSISVTEASAATGCLSEEATVTIPVALLANRFYTIPPCRLFDTRETAGPSAAWPALGPFESRKLTLGTRCALASSEVRALAVNQTVTGQTSSGELVLFRGDLPLMPNTASLSYRVGKTRANNGILELSRIGDGTFRVYNRSNGTVDFILDVSGVFK